MKVVVTWWPGHKASLHPDENFSSMEEVLGLQTAWAKLAATDDVIRDLMGLDSLQVSTWIFDYIDGKLGLADGEVVG